MVNAISRLGLVALWLSTIAGPAVAQQVSGFERVGFVNAVRSGDGTKVRELFDKHGKSILNAHDTDGDTALTLSIRKRHDWSYFFLREGADPNEPGAGGDTPLITAARIGFLGIAEQLLAYKAKIDAENNKGETALIAAVLSNQTSMVRLLLEHGASPDKTDNVAGLSALDYAKRNTRNRELLSLIESLKAKPPKTAKPTAQSADDFTL
jgi:ankyrin repeat protein